MEKSKPSLEMHVQAQHLRIGLLASLNLDADEVAERPLSKSEKEQFYETATTFYLPWWGEGIQTQHWAVEGVAHKANGDMFVWLQSLSPNDTWNYIDFSRTITEVFKNEDSIVEIRAFRLEYNLWFDSDYDQELLKFIPQRIIVNGLQWNGLQLTYDGHELLPNLGNCHGWLKNRFLVRAETQDDRKGHFEEIPFY